MAVAVLIRDIGKAFALFAEILNELAILKRRSLRDHESDYGVQGAFSVVGFKFIEWIVWNDDEDQVN